MQFKDYIPLAVRTESRDFPAIAARLTEGRLLRVLHGVMGLVTELEELQAAVDEAKVKSWDKDPDLRMPLLSCLDVVNAAEEVGDLFWYSALLGDELGLSQAPTTIATGELPQRVRTMTSMATIALDHLKKVIFYGKPLDETLIRGVVQFVLIFAASLAADFGTTPEAIMEKNIRKLAARYGDKFSDVAALNRDLATERQILES